MKPSLLFVSICAMLLAGCGSSRQNIEVEPTVTASAQDVTVALSVSCGTLIGDDGGLITASGEFLKDVNELSADSAEKAKGLSDDLREVARTAQNDLQAPIASMRKPLDDIVSAVENGGDLKLALNEFSTAGQEIIDLCSGETAASATPTKRTTAPNPVGLTYKLSCSIKTANSTTFTDYKAAWSQPFDMCYAVSASGTPSEEERSAAFGYSKDPDGAKHLYGVCAGTAGHYVEGPVSGSQANEITRALVLCPDHPKRAQLEANAAAALSMESDRQNGKLIGPGKYLVGKTAQPGTWQSQGEKVEDCYWEISDAQGNIIANNFISVAPQFTVHVPPTAAGFTVQGCSFRWIGE